MSKQALDEGGAKALDDVLGDFSVWCRCDSRECQRSVNYNQAKQTIQSLIAECLPEKRKLPDISGEWTEPWMHRIGGETDYNAAITKMKQRLIKKGLLDG